MTPLVRSVSPLILRVAFGVFTLGLVAGLVWTVGDLHGQPPAKKKRVEEEEDAKPTKEEGKTPPKKKRVEEEEEDVKPPPKRKVIRIEEEEENKGKKPPPHRPESPPPVADLKQAAEQAKHPGVKQLFRELAVPHDMVVFFRTEGVRSDTREPEFVEPIPDYLADDPTKFKGTLTLHRLDNTWKPLKPYNPRLKSIKFIRPYERLAEEAVREFLKQPYDQFPELNAKHLSRYDMLLVAEQALTAVLRFHASARERDLRRGDEWDAVEAQLRKYLLDEVLLKQLEILCQARDWDQVLALTRRLAETYTRKEDQERIARPVAELLKKSLADPTGGDDKKREARKRLHELEVQFPDSPVFKPISEGLQEQAQRLFEMAKSLGEDREKLKQDKERMARVLGLLDQAMETWPQLPGLHAYRLELSEEHPVLRVGVRGALPKYLSPARACTDTELRAVEMLFESLVKLTPDDAGIFRYRMGLAEGRPQVVPLGRHFRLPHNAAWSNGKGLNATDVRYTVERWLKNGKGTGRCAAWGLLLERPELKDPFQVTLRLNRGYLDPLSLMTFKILPQGMPQGMAVDSERFAQRPICSGPFCYEDTRSDEKGREYAGFNANPHYGVRAGKRGLPYIQEVRFYVYANPSAELEKADGLDLLLDLTAKEAADLRQRAAELSVSVPLPARTAVNRRIYFLAVNKASVPDREVRKALAVAINREQLLDAHFRGPLGKQVHKVLNGPFPAGSWAQNPRLAEGKANLDLYDPDLAKGLLQKKSVSGPLKLKYADEGPALDEAMKALAEQVKQATNIELELVKLDPYRLRVEVESQGYDLAYYHYDFPDDTYWLRPLFGPGNFLNFEDDTIQPLLQDAMGYRNFPEVQKYLRTVHEVLNREMPIIPLWQLDPLLAYRNDVRPASLDPRMVFTDAEHWRLQRK
jgi:peptide/nickel transport system substrate-binding protein